MADRKELFDNIKSFFVSNMVTIVFVIFGIVGFYYSGLSLPFFVNELSIRITRNSLLVLSLIIPVLAGMGLNFAIVLGAMAGQVAIIAVTHWGIIGVRGFMLAMLLSVPLAIVFGYLTGKLLNKTKGKEMITSLILGFFANGIYQLVFLILIGTLIPMDNPVMVLSSGVGLRVSLDLTGGLKYAIDHIWMMSIPWTALTMSTYTMLFVLIRFYINKAGKMTKKVKNTHLYILAVAVIVALGNIYRINMIDENSAFLWALLATISLPILYIAMKLYFDQSEKMTKKSAQKHYYFVAFALPSFLLSLYIMRTASIFNMLRVPIITVLAIAIVCVFTVYIMKTKLGQDLKTVGQDRHIATTAGIHSDKTRLTAIIISTVLASWGQLFFLQNLGTMSTYGSHEQVGMFSIAALLIGGASVSKATIGQALLGVVLFHTLFIVSPLAGRNVFGDAQLGEFFRAFVAYGVIGLSLGMHAWKKQIQSRNSLK